jgi:hypothetical protein
MAGPIVNAILEREVRAAVKRGWALTPCNGKRPLRERWQAEEPLSLDALLVEVRRGRNIGVRCGHWSGVVVIDADAGAEFVLSVETVTAVTGSGLGRHHYFRDPGIDLRNAVGKIAPHVDVRTDGGQVILAGSVHPETGQRYSWAPDLSPDDVELAQLPESIIELAKRPTPPERPRAHLPPNVSLAYVRRAAELEFKAVSVAPKGQRNARLNRAAFALGRFVAGGVLQPWEVEQILLVAAENSGLVRDDGEAPARATIASGIRAASARAAS